MSKYIHPENQTIVWEILNKIPIIKNHMSLDFEQFLIDLFKETICFIYENNKDKILTFRELETLNKETIEYINVKVKYDFTQLLFNPLLLHFKKNKTGHFFILQIINTMFFCKIL